MNGILPGKDSDQLHRKFADRKLDWDNPYGIHTFAMLKEYVKTEHNIVKPYKGISSSAQCGNNGNKSSTTQLKSKSKQHSWLVVYKIHLMRRLLFMLLIILPKAMVFTWFEIPIST